VLETIVNKTLSSEKRSRKMFESVLKNVVKNINNSVSEIRTETESLMDKYNETFVKGCNKSIGAMKVVTVNINKTMYEEINIITEALNDLTGKMSEANKKGIYNRCYQIFYTNSGYVVQDLFGCLTKFHC
jgi:hypothetical protein